MLLDSDLSNRFYMPEHGATQESSDRARQRTLDRRGQQTRGCEDLPSCINEARNTEHHYAIGRIFHTCLAYGLTRNSKARDNIPTSSVRRVRTH